ncbi:MAG: zinc ribbon domain-containing protein [Deltaproteobacteria bacterium]|nr:zinc ribbon domain-containing protein [Deltaproteobacteria bacterium]MBW1966724.1 zinc ribbon domain-containing protein [Deltaproteobacteria bacterium]MBW2097859.1 zinc ribbon domain-containing protein [Deltaproteobacteria bacterium]PXF54071.1 MAG: zinc ribbon domain-containing protein [Deltaproteobacteria bacterium]
MPIHEFRCLDCDYIFELLIMSKNEMDSVICPKCESSNVGKLMSVANIAVDKRPSRSSRSQPPVQQHTCDSGSCATIDLPGYER